MGRIWIACGCLCALSGCMEDGFDPKEDAGWGTDAVSEDSIRGGSASTALTNDAVADPPSCPDLEPEENEDPVPPLSMTASDGTGLILRRLRARAVVEQPLAFTEIEMVFENPGDREIEGRFEMTLPEGAAVSRFAMRIGRRWQEAEVVEKHRANVAYEDFLYRNRDPALLETSAGNRFRARIFPIPPRGRKELIISYSETLVSGCTPYRIPLRGLAEIDTLEVDVLVGGGKRVLKKERSFLPVKDVEIPPSMETGGKGLRYGNLAVARVTPAALSTPRPIERLTVLFDTSFSRQGRLQADIAKLARVVRALLEGAREDFHLKVICFDQVLDVAFDDEASRFSPDAMVPVLERRALGASNLEMALRHLVREALVEERVLIFTDGIATVGARQPGEIRRLAASLSMAGVTRIDAVADSGSRDEQTLLALTRAHPDQSGVVIDQRRSAERIAWHLQNDVLTDLVVQVPGADRVWPEKIETLQPGDSVLVYASLPSSRDMRVTIDELGYDSGRIPTRPAERPLVERATVQASIERLQRMLGEEDGDDATIREEILALSTQHRVLSDMTALLVLETEADFERFHVDRNALADILVVGKAGIELLQRKDAVLGGRGDVLGELAGDEVGESFGYGDLGLSGTGRGGGGVGSGTIGTRSLGRVHHLSGGQGAASLGGKRGAAPMIRSGAAMVRGTLAKDVVRRTMSRRWNELRFCYNQSLLRDPEFHGRVVLKLVIRESGEVVSTRIAASEIEDELFAGCIEETVRGWRFPRVQGGGLVVVTQPLVFNTKKTDTSGREAAVVPAIGDILDAISLPNAPEASRHPATGRRFEDVEQILAQTVVPAPDETPDTPLLPLTQQKTASADWLNRRFGRVGAGERRGSFSSASSVPAASQWVPVPASGVRSAVEPASASIAEKPVPENAYQGILAKVMRLIRRGDATAALKTARSWHETEPRNTMGLIALGEALEASGDPVQAARTYGSLIDQYPTRAEMLRMAGGRLERLGDIAIGTAADAFETAVRERPDHPGGHRLFAFALLKMGEHRRAFHALVAGIDRRYPADRFKGVLRLMREDLGIVGSVWGARRPERVKEIQQVLGRLRIRQPRRASTRFVLSWESDANDVDLHIYDGESNHVFFRKPDLTTGGTLYADVTTGFGPEIVTIQGAARAYPYTIQAHYFSRGPMGFGMGKLQIIRHDGRGGIAFSERPFVIMRDNAYVNLGRLTRSTRLETL